MTDIDVHVHIHALYTWSATILSQRQKIEFSMGYYIALQQYFMLPEFAIIHENDV